MKAEIKDYSRNYIGLGVENYQAIFIDGHQTNFWRTKEDRKDGFLINTPLETLQVYCDMINQGLIKPSDKNSLSSFDICSSLKWTPKKVNVVEYKSEMPLPHWTNEILSISGYENPDIKELIKKASQEHHTQYCKVVDIESKSILQNILIVVHPYGASFYAVN